MLSNSMSIRARSAAKAAILALAMTTTAESMAQPMNALSHAAYCIGFNGAKIDGVRATLRAPCSGGAEACRIIVEEKIAAISGYGQRSARLGQYVRSINGSPGRVDLSLESEAGKRHALRHNELIAEATALCGPTKQCFQRRLTLEWAELDLRAERCIEIANNLPSRRS